MFVLYLNDMRAPQIEIVTPVARAKSATALEAFMRRERVESYRDGRWAKGFRAGGALEWYNPPPSLQGNYGCIKDVGTLESQVARETERITRVWRTEVLTLPEIAE